MKKYFVITVLLTSLFMGFNTIDAKADSVTIATFADPSRKSNKPLFTVDFTQMKLTGGWSDANTGLILEIPCSDYTIENDNAFINAWFNMTDVNIISSGGLSGISPTEGGEIKFYANGNSTDPLVVINFESGFITRYGFGADDIFEADNVTITGSKIPSPISDEQFSFGFANLAKLPGHTNMNAGFTATAAFTSSAIIPEPATICLLALGSLVFIGKKKNKINGEDCYPGTYQDERRYGGRIQ